MPAERVPTLSVTVQRMGDAAVLRLRGVLDATTYLGLRDKIIKAALDEPAAVVVEVGELAVPAESAWAVFTSARWLVGRWPEVPILLVCGDAACRETIVRNGVARYVPVYPTVDAAVGVVSGGMRPRYRRRVRTEFPADYSSLWRARELVAECLTAWSQTDLIPVAKVIVTAFVENVLQHTDSRPSVRLETDGTTVTVAVADGSASPPLVREQTIPNGAPSGLRILSTLCRAWGNAPTPKGKTVWAVIGQENRL